MRQIFYSRSYIKNIALRCNKKSEIRLNPMPIYFSQINILQQIKNIFFENFEKCLSPNFVRHWISFWYKMPRKQFFCIKSKMPRKNVKMKQARYLTQHFSKRRRKSRIGCLGQKFASPRLFAKGNVKIKPASCSTQHFSKRREDQELCAWVRSLRRRDFLRKEM